MKDLLRVFKYITSYWGYAGLNILCNLFYICFSFFSLTLVIPFLSILFGLVKPITVAPVLSFNTTSIINYFYYTVGVFMKVRGPIYALIFVSVLFVVFSLLKNTFRYLGMFFLAPIRNGIIRDLRNDIYHRLLILPLSYYSEQRKGDIMSRITSDLNEIEWSVVSVLQMIIKDPINVIVYLFILIFISPKLMLISLITFPISGFIITKIGKSLKRNSEKGQRQLGVLVSVIEESLTGLRIIKAFNVIDFAHEKLKKFNNILFKIMVKIYRRRDLAAPLTETLAVIALVAIIFFGGNLVLTKKLSPESMILFILIFSQMIPPAQSSINAYYNLQRGMTAARRVNEIMDAQEVIIENENAISIKDFNKEIEYRNVSFNYIIDDNTKQHFEVLKNLNLTIPKGKIIAVVGPSGAGKSTLVDLLPRFYDCISGEIFIDNVPIKDLVISDVRGLIGIVSQDTILFNDTVFNNISFGMTNIKEEDVIAAAKVANAHEFIIKMEKAYHSNIGDRGANLSGGQRQRISIARAVLKNPPVMILDEATSALDTESERYVQEALTNLMKNRTSIVIAHRLSTIQHADEIIVMNKGEIVEKGNHTDLFNQNGLYTRLVNLQSFK